MNPIRLLKANSKRRKRQEDRSMCKKQKQMRLIRFWSQFLKGNTIQILIRTLTQSGCFNSWIASPISSNLTWWFKSWWSLSSLFLHVSSSIGRQILFWSPPKTAAFKVRPPIPINFTFPFPHSILNISLSHTFRVIFFAPHNFCFTCLVINDRF